MPSCNIRANSMGPLEIFLIFFVFQLFLIPIVIFVMVRKMRTRDGEPKMSRRDEALAKLSEMLAVPLVGGESRYPNQKWLSWIREPFRLEGEYQGRKLKVYHYTVSTGKSSTQYCAANINVRNPEKGNFSISEEGALSKMGKSLGMRDAETGNAKFDEIFYLRGDDQAFFRVGLIPSMQEKLIALHRLKGSTGRFSLNKGTLTYTELGEIRDEARIERFREAVPILV